MVAIYRIDIFKIMMRYRKGYSVEEIAKELSFPVGTVEFVIADSKGAS